MPPAAQALDVAMHIRSEPEADPVALAHEMISLLRSVRTPAPRARAAETNRRVGALKDCVGTRHIYGLINHFCACSPVGSRPAGGGLPRAPGSTAEGWFGQDLHCRLRAGV